MLNEKMFELGNKSSEIRELFEYGKAQKEIVGDDNVFDFSIGNPSIPCPKEVNDKLEELIKTMDPVLLHSYTSAPGDIGVRNCIANNLNERFNASARGELIYLTQGAAASLTISLKALVNEGDEVIVFAPFFPEYRVFTENAKGKLVVISPDEETFFPNFEEFEKKINNKTIEQATQFDLYPYSYGCYDARSKRNGIYKIFTTKGDSNTYFNADSHGANVRSYLGVRIWSG